MKRINWSKYVVFTEADEYFTLFHSVSRGIYLLESKTKNEIDEYITNQATLTDLSKRIVAKLYQQEFIVPSDCNEIEKFQEYRYTYYNSMFGTVIYILPTLNCNFVCPYCIQNEYTSESGDVISDETILSCANWILKFVNTYKSNITESMALNKNSNTIKLIFFGGEPTLYNEKNYLLIDKLKVLLPDWLNLSFTIITNGFEIDDNTILEYKKRGLTGFQITLDGPPSIHNKRRIPRDSQPTFEKILSTIKRSLSFGVKIVVRINVDEDNVDSICELIDILTENNLDGVVQLNIAPVDKNCSDANFDGHKGFVLNKFQKIFRKALFSDYTISLWECFCGVYARSFFVVAPNGKLYKCPSLLCDEYSIGSVYDFKLNSRYDNIVNYTLSDKCLDCSYVGLCGGGCYNQNVMNNKIMCQKPTFIPLVEAYCRSMKEYLRR